MNPVFHIEKTWTMHCSQHILDLISSGDGRRPANPAFWWVNDEGEEVKWSFEELGYLSRKAANILSEACGLQRGDRVIAVLPRVPEWWLLNVACMRTVESVTPDCQFLKSKLIVAKGSRDGWLNLKELFAVTSADHKCVKTRSQDPMLIYFTSGSTGSPKMVVQSHSSYGIGFATSGRYWMNLTPSDTMWNTSDTGWVKSAWGSVFAPWICGSCVFVHNMPQFKPAVIAETLSRYPITVFCTAPTAYRMLVQHDLSRYVDMLHLSSAAVVGIRIIDDRGAVLPAGEEGCIAIRVQPRRPFCMFSEYLDNPEKTAASLCGNFYVTGDRGIMDEDGYVWFVGRDDDIINSSGYRIGPFEVESALIQHPAVSESAVVSSPDPVRGEVVKAFVVLAPAFVSHDPEKLTHELQQHVKKLTAPYKYPRKVGKRPPNPAFWWVNGKGDEVKWSFEELGFLSRKVANVLTKVCGLQKGDRIIVILPRIPEWWLVYVACMRTGIVVIPGISQLSAKDVLYRLQASKATCIITSDMLAPAVDSVASECQFLKTKLIVSKGRREGWLNLTDLYKYWLDLTPSDVVWCTADTGWILASVGSLVDPWVFGSCIFIHMLPKIESAAILNTLCEFPIDTLIGAPTLFRMLVQNDLSRYKFMKLKNCMSGGEPLNPEVMEHWKSKTGLDICEVYGQTETGVVCCVFKGMKIKPGSMGKAVPLYDVQDNPKKTAESERGDFYVTGDRGIMDEDGYFQFIGRDDDIIISSGYRIGPFEVESALIEHPAVVETAVISSPDPLRGEVVKAFVVLSPTFSSSDLESLTRDLQEHVKKTTAPYKYPRKVEFVQELPKTVTGKIKRNELRKKEWGRM
ncbi:acyl-coenzyme A synthetase Acsm4 [Columba guinea]|nr:acyl-coenzyme A synthetase Acsm4 [Columba guinea]